MSTAQAAVSKDVSQEKTGGLRRYVALDAYRGFIMLLLASEGFGFAALKNDPAWGRVASWFDHVPWEGAVFWDMIQPAFMFMVGVAMPFAMARRIEKGATWGDNLRHVLTRCASADYFEPDTHVGKSRPHHAATHQRTVADCFHIFLELFDHAMEMALPGRWLLLRCLCSGRLCCLPFPDRTGRSRKLTALDWWSTGPFFTTTMTRRIRR